MSQTLALIWDAYRDLNSRKMFWIVLILSTLVAASFAAIGLTPTGFKIFFWSISSPIFNSKELPPGDFYKSIFLNYGIGFWLTWLATVLALISTASLFPDFLATGAVDLYLSKPISRLRLFLTKYLCGLLFVALQIGCFCAASFAVIGLRGGAWEPGIFLAVPIVLLFFSYLFCFCVLIGVWTRSTVAAVLLTFLFWVFTFGVHTTEVTLLTFKLTEESAATRLDTQIKSTQELLASAQAKAATRPTTRNSEYVTMYQGELKSDRAKREEDTHNSFDRPHAIFYDIKTVLPKTTETVALLERMLVSSARLEHVSRDSEDNSRNPPVELNNNPVPVQELQSEIRSRTVGWIVGTSVGFEAVVLVLAAWLFCRRDY
jgi:ABC-type transport system involved in multi-copper enzyme maturation permease subunit